MAICPVWLRGRARMDWEGRKEEKEREREGEMGEEIEEGMSE